MNNEHAVRNSPPEETPTCVTPEQIGKFQQLFMLAALIGYLLLISIVVREGLCAGGIINIVQGQHPPHLNTQ